MCMGKHGHSHSSVKVVLATYGLGFNVGVFEVFHARFKISFVCALL